MNPFADLVLANRAYADHESPQDEGAPPVGGAGGLLAVVKAVLAPWDGANGTTWVGAGRGRHDREHVDERGFELLETSSGPLRQRRLFFGDEVWARHYAESSNGFLWPLFHMAERPLPALTGYFPTPAPPSDKAWAAYREVNTRFAAAAFDERASESCWVHDYQLALVPGLLLEGGYGGRVGFFLHTPFPDLAIAAPYLDEGALGRLREVVVGMLGADLVGVQTERDCARFRAAVTGLGLGSVAGEVVTVGGRRVALGAYPVGIDADDISTTGEAAELPPAVAEMRAAGLPVVVGLEREDYTKGIPERLRAVAEAYRRGARFAYAGFASPTRDGVAAYEPLHEAIAVAASEAERAAGEAGCPFIQQSAAIPWGQVVALQRSADVVFTSSLADGMNLVPLQAAVAQGAKPAGERAVVLCGVGTGVAEAYADCVGEGLAIVDPLDGEAMVAALEEALAGRPGRVTDRTIERIRGRDARHWATGYLRDLMGTQR